jgi:hypothetical protein
MKDFDQDELRELLDCFDAPEPPDLLVARTMESMRVELASRAVAPAPQGAWVFGLAGLSIAMSLCVFYVLTVGTVLQYFAPTWMAYYLQKSLLVFTAVGGVVVAGAFMTLVLKHVANTNARHERLAVETVTVK